MNTNFFLSATAAGILALSMASGAFAGDSNMTGANGKHTITLVAGNQPHTVELRFDGAQRVSFYQSGTLQITRADGTTWKYRPNITQDVNGKRKYLMPAFSILGRDRVAVRLSKVDPSAPVLVEGKNPNS
jgi:hypothetical protein